MDIKEELLRTAAQRYLSGDRELRTFATTDTEVRQDDDGNTLVGHAAVFNIETTIGGFFRELVGYLARSDRVRVGDPAPDFELVPLHFYDFDSGRPDEQRNAGADPYRGVRLSSFKDEKPVALIFGSYT